MQVNSIPVPTSPCNISPFGESNCRAASWLVRTLVRARLSLSLFCWNSDPKTPDDLGPLDEPLSLVYLAVCPGVLPRAWLI